MTIFYPDLSQYDAAVSVEPGTVIVGARATLSTSVADIQYERFKLETWQVGGFFFAYHWLNHGNVAAQALWAYQHAGSTPLMLDVEDEPGNTGYAGVVTVQDVLSFVDAYRKLGGTCHLVYLPQWYWSGHMGSPDLTPLGSVGLHLIASNYTAYSDSGSGWQSYGGLTPVAWQYTDVMLYGGGLVDFNAYKGTVESFIELATGDNVMADIAPSDSNAWQEAVRVDSLVHMKDTVDATGALPKGEANELVAAIKQIQSTLDSVVSALAGITNVLSGQSVTHAGTLHVSGDVTVSDQ